MMRRARIFHRGRALWARVQGDMLVLPGGERLPASDAHWLPPITPGATIFALGLNFADHNAELGFKAAEPPLVFLKGPNTLVGHQGVTPRPADANQMHPECELVAVIGRPGKRIPRAQALDHVAGYTIACDYAIREYLENYYRPNLRVKNRDATTPIGPWIVDAADIPDPQALAITTLVNGVPVQAGSTRDMVLDVAGLIEHLSETMTLRPGDMILTGTPQGLHFVGPSDRVECTIEAIGTLINHVEAAA